MLNVGNVTLGDRPRVVIALRDDQDRAVLEHALSAGADIIELRVDSFSNRDQAYCVSHFERLGGLPLLLTIRAKHEGGDWSGSESERLTLFKALMPLCDAVDIELSSTEIRDEVIADARAHGCCVLGSFHNFEETPDDSRLEQVCALGREAGVDIVKIAAKCNNINDLRQLARLCLHAEDQPMIVIGMGAQSMLSRVFFPALGSLLTYTFLGERTAPGQLNLPDLVSALGRYYPS